MSTLTVSPTTTEKTIIAFIKERLGAGDQVMISATEPYMSPNEVAGLIGVSRPYIVKKIEAGEISATKRGNRHRIRFDEAQRFADQYRNDLAAALGQDF